jgi:hypothetical protein
MDYFSIDDVDDELGIAPLVAMAAPAVMGMAQNLLGGLLGGGKSKAAPAAAPAASAPASDNGVNLEAIRGVVQSLLAQLPPSIKADLRTTLQEIQASQSTREDLARNIKAAVEPQLAAAIAGLQQAAIQREATSEHNRLVKEDERWEGNKRVNTLILSKILELSMKLDEYNKKNTRARAAMGLPQ